MNMVSCENDSRKVEFINNKAIVTNKVSEEQEVIRINSTIKIDHEYLKANPKLQEVVFQTQIKYIENYMNGIGVLEILTLKYPKELILDLLDSSEKLKTHHYYNDLLMELKYMND